MKKMLARIGEVTVLVSMMAMLVTTPANAQVVYDLGDFPFSFFGATDFHATLETSTTGTFTTEADIENFLNLATYSVTLKNGATIVLELNNGNSFWDLKIEALGGGTGGATATLTATASEITLDFSTPNEITSVGLFLGLPGNILQYTQSNNVTDSNFVFVDHDAIIFANADVPFDDPFIFPALAQADFAFELVDHPGAPDTQVIGINDRGDVVGNGFTNVATLPFVFASKKGTLTDVAPLAGFVDTGVVGINDAGIMVGSVDDDAFIRDKKGNFTVFSHPGAVAFTQARAVNNKGLVTGFRNTGVPFVFSAAGFIYDPKSDTFTDLNPTSFFTIAQGINSKGEVVGSSNFLAADDPCAGLGNPFLRYGWFRATDGTVTYFEVNGSHTSARGINDAGSIAGFFIDLNDGIFKGFQVKLDGSQCQSLTVAGGDVLEIPGFNLFAGSINNSGVIAGTVDDGINLHGFIATPQ